MKLEKRLDYWSFCFFKNLQKSFYNNLFISFLTNCFSFIAYSVTRGTKPTLFFTILVPGQALFFFFF